MNVLDGNTIFLLLFVQFNIYSQQTRRNILLALVWLLLSVATSVGAMDRNEDTEGMFLTFQVINAQDENGSTLLHYVAMLNNPITGDIDRLFPNLKEIDSERSRIAANLIMRGDARVNVQDKNGKTPYDYAQQEKKHLPLTYEVIDAGKTQEDFRNIMNEMMGTGIPIDIDMAKLNAAFSTLVSYSSEA